MDKLYERIEDSMLDVGRQSRYYLEIADVQQKWHLGCSMAILTGTLTAGVLLLTYPAEPELRWLSAGLFLFVGFMTILTAVFDFSRVAQLARDTADRLDEIDVQLRQLWFEAWDSSEGPVSEDTKVAIDESLIRLEREIDAATRVDIRTNYKLNKKSSEEAERVITTFYREKTTADQLP